MTRRIYPEPGTWTQRALTPEVRAAIEALLPPDVGVYVNVVGASGKTRAFLVIDGKRSDYHHGYGRNVVEAVRTALRDYRETVTADSDGWVREWTA